MTLQMQQNWSSITIVERYLQFFVSKNHVEIPGSPLVVPGNSTSFVIAGMQPLLPYLLAEQKPPAPRLTSLQRCLRSDDAENVGSNGRKNTLFHMLGNWSLGDYDKSEAIALASEFLFNVLELKIPDLWVTTFGGDVDLGLPCDEGAMREWSRIGIPEDHIVLLGAEDNLWTMGGPGPCGPCTEIFVDRGVEAGCGMSTCQPGCTCERFLEIWNLVFLEYERFADGSLRPLPQRNIDTGMGLERMATVLQHAESSFTTDLFVPAMQLLQEFLPGGYADGTNANVRAQRVILDHTRSILFAGLAHVLPARDGRGSVVRRLLRRAARQGHVLGIKDPFLYRLVRPLADAHQQLLTAEERVLVPQIERMIAQEELQFKRLLTTGLRYLMQLEPDESGFIKGEDLFQLHAEKGFPADLAAEILEERGLSIDWSGYEQAQQQHRNVSRVSAERFFYRT